jgi:UrcA family protein
MRTLPLAIIGVGMLLAATEGRAQTGPVVVEGGAPTSVVSYADLDLTSAAGRSALDHRVVRAASDICIDNRRKPLLESMAERQCFSVAVSRARVDIEHAVAGAQNRLASRATIRVAAN